MIIELLVKVNTSWLLCAVYLLLNVGFSQRCLRGLALLAGMIAKLHFFLQTVIYPKMRDDTLLRVNHFSTFRSYNECTRWFFRFNGAECSAPEKIDWLDRSEENMQMGGESTFQLILQFNSHGQWRLTSWRRCASQRFQEPRSLSLLWVQSCASLWMWNTTTNVHQP